VPGSTIIVIRKKSEFIMKLVVIFTVILIYSSSLLAQSSARAKTSQFDIARSNRDKEIKPLKIGDLVPNIVFENVLNYKSKKANLSDFKGKLVILDMWSVNCATCIAEFPKLENLQKEFGDKIQILLINPHDVKYDSEEKIKLVLSKVKIRTGFYPTLPIPIHDSILNKFFPHKSVPHQIWISPDGIVAAITGSVAITTENILGFLKNDKTNMPLKDDWAFDDEKPLFVDNNGGSSNDFVYRSVFTPYKRGLGFNSGVRVDKNSEVVGIYMLNQTLGRFTTEAYSAILSSFSKSRTIIDVKNPLQFQLGFDSAYVYCYDLIIPPTPWSTIDTKNYLQEDLRRYFNISVRKEKRKIKCLILTATNTISKSFTRHKKAELDLSESSAKKYIHNYSIAQILNFIEQYGFDRPLIDETRLTNAVDIEFPDYLSWTDSNSVLQALKKAGFSIREEERNIEIVVISDK
jgi:thiol-disulfide isomerase/thioredoxin